MCFVCTYMYTYIHVHGLQWDNAVHVGKLIRGKVA